MWTLGKKRKLLAPRTGRFPTSVLSGFVVQPSQQVVVL